MKRTLTKAHGTDEKLDPSRFIHRTPLIRLINQAGEILERLGISQKNRSAESLAKAACRKTGFSDWGDESFRESLEALVESFRKDAHLNFVGWFMTHQKLIHLLSNRLRIQDEIKRHPEILKVDIRRPLFIVSLPRTGTTLLQNLLNFDPANRSLLLWEAFWPAPAPVPENRDTDPRIESVEKRLRFMHLMAPNLPAIHTMGTKRPEECLFLMENTFSFPSFPIGANLSGYSEWLSKRDMIPVYQYHRLQLQILQWRVPTVRWLLKAPLHMYALEALLAVYPDACVIQTHRDPLKVIPSSCSLRSTLRGTASDRLDLEVIGRQCLNRWKNILAHCMEVRDSDDPDRYVDLHYRDFARDPFDGVRRIYTHFKYEFNAEFEKRLREWIGNRSGKKRVTHQYSLEQFGLNRDMVVQAFSNYYERFGIEPE